MAEFEKGYQAYLNKIPFSAHEPMEWIDGYMQAMDDVTDKFLNDIDIEGADPKLMALGDNK